MLLTVLYAPRRMFAALGQGPNAAPFLPVVAFALCFGGLVFWIGRQTPVWQDAGLLGRSIWLTFIVAMIVVQLLLAPLLNTLVVGRLRRPLGSEMPSRFTLLSAFILGSLPVYCEAALAAFAQLPPVGLNRLLPLVKTSSPSHIVLAAILGVVTLGFLWTAGLWWVALTELLRLRPSQGLRVVGLLVLVDMLIIGLIDGLFSAGLYALIGSWGLEPPG
jgi:hypothetical protein